MTTNIWYLNNKPYKINNSLLLTTNDTYQAWLINNKYHPNGSSIINHDGSEWHLLDNKLHRMDGPAIIHPDGFIQYRAHGIRYDSLEELIVGVVINQ